MRLYGLSRTVGLTVLLYSYLQIVTCKPALSASQQVEKATKESDISKIRIEAFKRGILDQLGYSVPPNVSKVHHSIETKRQRIREFRDYLKSKNDMQHIPDSMAMRMDSRTIHQTYTGENKQQELESSSHRNPVLYYRISEGHPDDLYRELAVISAKLQLFKKQTNSSLSDEVQSSRMDIKVFRVEQHDRLGLIKGKQIASKLLDVSVSGWEDFDISEAVQEWIDSPQSNLGLTFSSDTHNISQIISFSDEVLSKNLNTDESEIIPKHSSKSTTPLLKLHAQERPILKRRYKRQAGRRDCTSGDGENRCCRFRTQINFHDIGWDWVIAPDGYEAFHCEGSCPDRFKMANTFTGIKSVLHKMDPSRYSAPCCVPSSFKPLTILHEDAQHDLVFTDFPDMVVQDCKCA